MVEQEKGYGIKSWFQHHANPGHIYCRLANIVGRKVARKITIRYETIVWKLMYAQTMGDIMYWKMIIEWWNESNESDTNNETYWLVQLAANVVDPNKGR